MKFKRNRPNQRFVYLVIETLTISSATIDTEAFNKIENRMNNESYYAISQIAVTLTGFIAILVAIQPKDHQFSRLAVATILGTSAGALLFSFIPEFLLGIFNNNLSWQIACGTFGVYHLILIINHQARQLQFKKNTPTQLVIVILSLFPVVGLKLAVGLGFLIQYADKVFFLGLLWCIFIPLYLFGRIILENTKEDS